jgi:hypothetical protein
MKKEESGSGIFQGVQRLRDDPFYLEAVRAKANASRARYSVAKIEGPSERPEIVLAPPLFDFDPGELLVDGIQWDMEVVYQDSEGNLTRRPFSVLRIYGDPPDVCNYLWGYCHLRHEPRTLAVRRIKQIVENDTGKIIPDEDVELWLPVKAGIRIKSGIGSDKIGR